MRRFELDRAGEIESLALQDQAFADNGFKVDVEVVGIEFMRGRYDLNGTLSLSVSTPKACQTPLTIS